GQAHTPAPADIAFATFAELGDAWDASESAWSAYLAELSPADLDRPVSQVVSAGGNSQPLTTALLDVLLHVCPHAQYTTAQAVNMLRQLGVPAPDLPPTMLISMARAGL